jgi:hypothetical protein
MPLVRHMTWDVLDHAAGLRTISAVAFYDAGNAYVNGHAPGPTAHALGGGLRLDTALLSFVERLTLRFDVAKAINVSTPVQFWFGVQHAF